jgi:hypothetical protein
MCNLDASKGVETGKVSAGLTGSCQLRHMFTAWWRQEARAAPAATDGTRAA